MGLANFVRANRHHILVFLVSVCTLFFFFEVWRQKNETSRFPIPSAKTINIEHRHPSRTLPLLSCDVSGSKVGCRNATSHPPCDMRYSEYTPCEHGKWSRKLPISKLEKKERHCPAGKWKLLKCLVPAPLGYKRPLPWPESRDYVWYVNVPHKHLTVAKAEQHWISYEGDKFRFPGGGTSFPGGAKSYIETIDKLINLQDGSIRVAVDTGCGVASWGAYLLSKDVLTMSFAPKDSHEAQVQFALERGVPATLGILASRRLPYPARVFDMAHCSRCLIPWTENDGKYLIEVDRVLRPGGYWILSGPPINWNVRWEGWQRTREDLEAEQTELENLARSLCWKKFVEEEDIAIWQKPINHLDCEADRQFGQRPLMCSQDEDPDKAWYTKMETCLTRLPEVLNSTDVAGGPLLKWPERLNTAPPRIVKKTLAGLTDESFGDDTRIWQKRVSYYKSVNNLLGTRRYRNLLDMNSFLGGFAAALVYSPVWVMNVVPIHAKLDTLGIIYERGLIGTYHDWCEAMSTYPRTYDLIHADMLFSLYMNRCEMEFILLEMDRILRPQGYVIIRDNELILRQIRTIAEAMRWNCRILEREEDESQQKVKILFAEKSYWTSSASPDPNQSNIRP